MSSAWNMPQFLEELNELLSQIKDSDMIELSWKKEGLGLKFRRKKGAISPYQEQSLELENEKKNDDHTFQIRSSVVGIFHFPDKMPEIGSVISDGKELGFITSINVVYPLEIEKSGRLLEIHAAEGDMVDFGKVLFTLEF